MATVTFGSGKLFFKHPTTSQVYQIGEMTDVALSFEASTKEYYGSKQFAIVSVATQKKVSGKASTAIIDGKLISVLMSGSVTNGREVLAEYVASGTSVLVSPTGTSFAYDYGVIDASGNPMNLTASAPAVGAYAVSAGTYTFNGSEPAGALINYSYNVATGQTFAIVNADMGLQTNFSLFLQERSTNGELFGVKLNSVVIPSLSYNFKNEDFSAQDLSFTAQVNASGQLGSVFSE